MAGSFVDAHGNTAAADSVVVTAPDGIADGDILICLAHARRTTGEPTITMPAGFAGIADANPGSNHHMVIGWKLASSESGNYTVAGASATTMEATISVWRGLAASPVDQFSNTAYATSDTIIRGATITTTAAGIVIWCGYLNRASADSITPETGYTEAVEVGQAAASYHYIEQSYLLGVAASTTTGSIDGNSGGAATTKHAFLLSLKDYVAPSGNPYYYYAQQ